jgi:hypothetical protein
MFDRLFMRDDEGARHYEIPYPFDALIRYFEKQIDNGDRHAVPHILIPRGRSLQREAAAPDYFRFPRSIITLDGEPAPTPGQAETVMKYRLFIGYQEKSKLLEIISYNEAAGRFEFQLAENYQAGTTPRVSQANRKLCMSCHQNGGPIFAASPWSETNFNPQVAIKLSSTQPARFSSLITALSDDAQAIDLAVNRANYLAAAQLIWQSGCKSDSSGPGDYRCRAAILRALLQYRLSGELTFDAMSSSYRTDYIASLDANWRIHWPHGLLLASAQIPDSNPFEPPLSDASHDPLSPRVAHAHWQEPSEALARGIVYLLAGFLTEADIRRIDRHLLHLASNHKTETRNYKTSCVLVAKPTTGHITEYRYDCGNQSASRSINATIEIEYAKHEPVSLRMLNLTLPGEPIIWQPTVSAFKLLSSSSSGQIQAQLSGASGVISARLANGNRIDEMILSWTQKSAGSGLLAEILELELIVINDFKFLRDAIKQMVTEGLAGGSDALSSLAFRQRAIIADLEKSLGMKTAGWCCDFESVVQIPTPSQSTNIAGPGNLEPFYRHCAGCHDGNTTLPPGFLHGDSAQVDSQLRQCAPRILRRLEASRSSVDDGRISPMPPIASLSSLRSVDSNWRSSDAFRNLTTYIRELINHDGEVSLSRVINSEYQSLRPCLG